MRGWIVGFSLITMALMGCSRDTVERTVYVPVPYTPQPNQLYNSNFDLWQRGPEAIAFNAPEANDATIYGPDRWYLKNSLGGASSISIKRVDGENTNSSSGARIEITKSPSDHAQVGCEVYQTLENRDSLALINRPVSFSVKLKGVGDAKYIGIQFMYDTSEKKVTLPMGPEKLVRVYNDRFVTGANEEIFIDPAVTNRGVVGVRIRLVEVSSGLPYEKGNGFIIEQAMVNFGKVPEYFSTRFQSANQELSACQRYYEKSYARDVTPGTESPDGVVTGGALTNLLYGAMTIPSSLIQYLQIKRTSKPLVTLYSPDKSTQKNRWYVYNGKDSWHQDAAPGAQTDRSFYLLGPSIPHPQNEKSNGYIIGVHWTSDAEI